MSPPAALFLDLDGAELTDHWPVKPALVVEAVDPIGLSHYQCWWPHEGSGRFEHWQHLQGELAVRYGASQRTEVAALGRCAGFWNLSTPAAPFQVRILADHRDGGHYTLPWEVPSLAGAFGIEFPATVAALPHRIGGLSWRQASEVQQRRIEWLWPGRIALGKLTGIAGLPDQGKSQLTAAIAAAVTTGPPHPSPNYSQRCPFENP